MRNQVQADKRVDIPSSLVGPCRVQAVEGQDLFPRVCFDTTSHNEFDFTELESTLVALIPLNDERLKPKRTWRYILIWVIICFLVGGSVIFVLMPRTVTLSSDIKAISLVNVTKADNATRQYIDFNFIVSPFLNSNTLAFQDKLNVTSGNYLPISIINVTATIVSKFQPWSLDQIGYGFNNSVSENNQLTVYGKSSTEVLFNNSVSLQGYVA
jgi:hypothetical protein